MMEVLIALAAFCGLLTLLALPLVALLMLIWYLTRITER